MKKLRFKNRNGILYFGIDGKFRSSKLKFTNVNKNIIIGKFKQGLLDEELNISTNSTPSIKTLLDEIMDQKVRVLKHNSINAYNIAIKSYIVPYFGEIMVSQIKPIDIKKFQDGLVNKGFKRQTITLCRVLLKEVFAIAILNEYMTINPVLMVDIPKIKYNKQKQKPCSLDEIDEIISIAKSSDVKNFLGVSFFTGLRSGELLALSWDDVDFETDTISVTKTISAGTIGTPKTLSSERDIEILPKAKEFLKAQRLETGLHNSFVFLNTNNSHHSMNGYFAAKFKNILKKLNLEDRNLHNTRHTFASMMLNNNIDPLWVSNTLGHCDLNITLKTYTHYMPKKEKMTIGFLDKRYKNGTHDV